MAKNRQTGGMSLCSVIAWEATTDRSLATASFTRPGQFTLHLLLTQRPIAVASSLQTTCTDWLIDCLSQHCALSFHLYSCRHTSVISLVLSFSSFAHFLTFTFAANLSENVAQLSDLLSPYRPSMSLIRLSPFPPKKPNHHLPNWFFAESSGLLQNIYGSMILYLPITDNILHIVFISASGIYNPP